MNHQEWLEVTYEALKHNNKYPQFLDLVHYVFNKLKEKGLVDSAPEYAFGNVQHTVRRIFWHFFKNDIITLGNSGGDTFPWFEITDYGQTVLAGKEYITDDVIRYLTKLEFDLPDLGEISKIYLREAIECFNAERYIPAAVMIGVAAENEFYLLLYTISVSKFSAKFKKVDQTKWITKKIEHFMKAIPSLKDDIDNYNSEVYVDLEIQIGAILALVKNTRNNAGHPTAKTYERDDIFALLHLIIPCFKKLHQLKHFFMVLQK